jgi:DNA-3-methyladenine glycosylase
MYYSRGNDSIGFSTLGKGNSILIKSAIPYLDDAPDDSMLETMHTLNPINGRKRENHRLCSGQTLLCKSLGLKVKEWNKASMNDHLYLKDVGYTPELLITCKRLGMSERRYHQLLQRVFDDRYSTSITKDPRVKSAVEGVDFVYG